MKWKLSTFLLFPEWLQLHNFRDRFQSSHLWSSKFEIRLKNLANIISIVQSLVKGGRGHCNSTIKRSQRFNYRANFHWNLILYSIELESTTCNVFIQDCFFRFFFGRFWIARTIRKSFLSLFSFLLALFMTQFSNEELSSSPSSWEWVVDKAEKLFRLLLA